MLRFINIQELNKNVDEQNSLLVETNKTLLEKNKILLTNNNEIAIQIKKLEQNILQQNIKATNQKDLIMELENGK